jgi:hypothetical protein
MEERFLGSGDQSDFQASVGGSDGDFAAYAGCCAGDDGPLPVAFGEV